MTVTSYAPAGLLSVAEVAHHTSLSAKTVRRLIAAGKLPARRVGKRVLVLRCELEAWEASLPAVDAGAIFGRYLATLNASESSGITE